MNTQLRQVIERKRLIFTITTGRSGTAYLAHVLSFLPGVVSYHEPEPKFSDIMFKAQFNKKFAYDFWISKKLPKIAEEREDIYIETSHLFCKGFIEPLLGLGIIPDLIVLRRPPREVAISLYKINAIPGRTTDGLRFLLSPEAPNILPLPYWQILHDYQLCFWYCLEIESRVEKYIPSLKAKGVRVAETSLKYITTPKGIKDLIGALSLPMPKNILNYSKKMNTKNELKQMYSKPTPPNIDELEDEVIMLTNFNIRHNTMNHETFSI